MKLEIKGKYIAASEYKQHTDNFGTQKFYLDIQGDSQYEAIAEFQVNNQKIDLTNFNKGQNMNVFFNISGRKWEKEDRKGFIQNLTVWKIVVDTPTAAAAPVKADPLAESQRQLPDSQSDDLPF
jgi:hypothetical protein